MSDALVELLMREVSQLRKDVDQLREEVEKLKTTEGAKGGSTQAIPPEAAKAAPPNNFGKKFHQWKSQPLTKTPFEFVRPYSAVKDGKVYFNAGKKSDGSPEGFMVHFLDLEKDKWVALPKSTQYFGTLAVVQDMVTYIGGKQQGSGLVTGNLLSFQGTGKKGEWQECLPPLPTPRFFAGCLTKGNYLVVVGGENFDKRLTTVEVLNMDTMEWTEVSPLPEPTINATVVANKDFIYVLAGFQKYGYNFSNAAYSCSFSELIGSNAEDDEVWDTLPDVPSDAATATVMHDTLVAVGGWSPGRQDTPMKNLFAYSPSDKAWNSIGFLGKGRAIPGVVSLDDGSKTLVVGGQISPVRFLEDVEIIEAKN